MELSGKIESSDIIDTPKTINLFSAPHPFSDLKVDYVVPVGKTIREILEITGLGTLSHLDAHIFVNDIYVERSKWRTVCPTEDQIISVRVIPAGGGKQGQKNILRIVATIALVVVTTIVFKNPAIGAQLGSLGTAVVSTGVMIAGSLAINALIPPVMESGKNNSSNETFHAITGAQNRANPYGVIQQPFGLHRMYPTYAALPYTENYGKDSFLRMLFCVGFSEHGYNLSDWKIGETDLAEFSDVSTIVGNKADITEIYTNTVYEDQLSGGIEIAYNDPAVWTTRTTQTDTEEITLDITFPIGLYKVKNNGKTKGTHVVFRAEYYIDSAWEPFPGSPVTIHRKAEHRYVHGFQVSNLPAGQYDVRVRRETPTDAGALGYNAVANDTYWTALRSISYTDGPPFNLDNCLLIAMRIKASGQLNGIIDSFNLMVQAKLPVWDGDSWLAATATRNPAWAYAEVMRGLANKRALSDSKIDGDGLLAWATECDTEGYYFDAVLDQKRTVFEVLRNIAAVGRASFGIVDNLYTVIQDLAQSTPRQHFSERNSWGFSGAQEFPDVPHAIRCRFKNSEIDYEDDEITVYDDGYDSDNASLFETMDFWGVTTYQHVWKLARYYIAVGRLRRETYKINVDIEHLVCTRGDLVRHSHKTILNTLGSARIKAINGDVVTMDTYIPMEESQTYAAQIRQSDMTMLEADIVLDVGEQTEIALSTTTGITVGDMIFFGPSGEVSEDCLISKIEPGPDLSARLTLINYNEAIYSAHTGTIPDYDPVIVIPPDPSKQIPPTPVIKSVTLQATTANIPINTVSIQLLAVVDYYVSIGTEIDPDFFQAQYREVDDDGNTGWDQLPNLNFDDRRAFFEVEDSFVYDFRIRSLTNYGQASAWATTTNYTVTYASEVPNDITTLALVEGGLVWSGRDVELIWDEPTDLWRVARYKLEIYKTSPETLLRTKYIESGELTANYTFEENYQDNSGSPTGTLTFKIWPISYTDEPAENEDQIDVTHAAPVSVTGLGGTAFRGGVLFTWTHTKTSDFSVFWVSIQVEDDPVSWHVQTQTYFSRTLTEAEVTEHGADATIYIIVYVRDIFSILDAGSSYNLAAGVLFVQPTDIDDFPSLLSNLYPIPVVIGLSLSAGAGDTVDWAAFSIWYDGIEYEINSGNTGYTYSYFKDPDGVGGATSLISSDVHPADDTWAPGSEWDPEEDFIIFTYDADTDIWQAAWYAMANAVIGSAYIKDAAIQDLHVDTISGSKIIANTITLTGLASDVTYQMAPAVNLVKNGEFKKDAISETDPEDWTVGSSGTPPTAAVILPSTYWPAGTQNPPWDENNAKAFYVVCDDAAEYVYLRSTDYIPVNCNIDYCLSAWAKLVNNNDRFVLRVQYFDVDYAACSPAYQNVVDTTDLTGDWEQLSAIVYNTSSGETNKFPSDCAYVRIMCIVQYQTVGATMVSRIAFHEGHFAQRGITVIDGGNIYTGTVTADQIAAGTITASEIATGTITATEIAADAITADKIDTGAIVIDGIHGDVSYEMSTSYNLVKNGEFRKDTNGETTPEDWDTTVNDAPPQRRVWAPTPVATYGAPWDLNNALVYYANCNATSQYVQLTSTDYIPINEDKNYCLSCWVRGVGGTRDFSLGLLFFDSSYVACSPSYQYGSVLDISPATSWNQVEWVCYNSSSSESYKFPSGCAYVKVDIWPQYEQIGGNLFSRVAFQEGLYPSRGTTVIDGGYIYADTITANEINGTNFGTLTISSGKIAINTTDALEIQSGGNVVVKSGGDIELESGGDVRLYGNASDPAEIQIYDTGDTLSSKIGSNATNYSYWLPNTNGVGTCYIGSAGLSFDTTGVTGRENLILRSYYSGSDNTYIDMQSNTGVDDNYIDFRVEEDGVWGNIRMYNDSFYPAGSSGNLSLGTASNCWTDVRADAGVTSCSDVKYKNNVRQIPLGLDFINALMPISFYFNKTGKRPKKHKREYHGLIGSEVEQALIEVGYDPGQFAGIKKDKDEDGEEWYGLIYEQLIAPLIKAVQELSQEVKILKKVKS